MNRNNFATTYQNEEIRIRPYRVDDRAGLFDCIKSSMTQMKPYLSWVHDNYSLPECDKWIKWMDFTWQTGKRYEFVIEKITPELFLGGVGLWDVNRKERVAKLSYWLRTDHTGRGIVTSAATLIITFAKEQLGLKQLMIYMSHDNLASIVVAKKLGAVYQGTKIGYETINGRTLDCDFYLLTL